MINWINFIKLEVELKTKLKVKLAIGEIEGRFVRFKKLDKNEMPLQKLHAVIKRKI